MLSQLTPEQITQRGEKIYVANLQAIVEPRFVGQYTAIDIDSGDYAVSPNAVEAMDEIHASHAEPVVALLRIGYETTGVIGGRAHLRDGAKAA